MENSSGDCGICYERFNHHSKIAKLLDCGHTYCRSCLIDYTEKYQKYKCPTCNKEIAQKPIDSHLTNYQIMQNIQEEVSIKSDVSNDLINVIIQSLSNYKFSLQINKNLYVFQLKQLVSEQIGIKTQFITLIYNGVSLIDNNFLNQYKLRNNSVIQHVIKFKGAEYQN